MSKEYYNASKNPWVLILIILLSVLYAMLISWIDLIPLLVIVWISSLYVFYLSAYILFSDLRFSKNTIEIKLLHRRISIDKSELKGNSRFKVIIVGKRIITVRYLLLSRNDETIKIKLWPFNYSDVLKAFSLEDQQ